MRSRLAVVAIALAAPFAASACQSLEDGAREAHATEFSCPVNRVTVHARKDLDAYTLIFGSDAAPQPEADVKRDPARYAMWKKQQAESRAQWNAMGELWEAKGCGHDVIYFCAHANSRGDGTRTVSCTPTRERPAGKK